MTKVIDIPRGSLKSHELQSWSDEVLLARYREDADRQAFETLVQRYEHELYNYLRRYLGDAQLAEDAFQRTFLQVHMRCGQFDHDRKFRPWLYTIATNQAIDLQRRNKRHRGVSLQQRQRDEDHNELGALVDLLVSHEEDAEAQFDSAQQRAWVRRALESLGEPLRQVVQLVYFQGLKYREAGDVLGIPTGTVKSRMHAALLKLNEAWRTTHPVDFD